MPGRVGDVLVTPACNHSDICTNELSVHRTLPMVASCERHTLTGDGLATSCDRSHLPGSLLSVGEEVHTGGAVPSLPSGAVNVGPHTCWKGTGVWSPPRLVRCVARRANSVSAWHRVPTGAVPSPLQSFRARAHVHQVLGVQTCLSYPILFFDRVFVRSVGHRRPNVNVNRYIIFSNTAWLQVVKE